MTLARGAALGALLLAGVVVAVLLLGGSSTHDYRVVFQNAGQLVNGDDVQVGGRRVGNVKKIELTNDNQALVTMSVESDFAPLHKGTKVLERATSLSGIANRYIALTPGPNNAPKLDDNFLFVAERGTSIVDLDQLFNTLDARTRRSLQQVIQGSADQYQGKEKLANLSAHYFNPALSTTARLVNEIDKDQGAFTNFIVSSSRVVNAISERKDDLTNLVTNANTTGQAIGDENVALSQTLRLLPPTLRRANSTFVDLRSTLNDLDVLTNASKPATKRLAPFLRELRPLVHDARPTIADLRHLIHEPGQNNDLIDATAKLPRLEQIAHPAFAQQIKTLKRSQSVIEFIRPYTPDFVGWLRDFGQDAAAYDANGHYARIQPIFSTFSQNNDSTSLTPIDLTKNAARFLGYENFGKKGVNVNRRCPGTASQAPPPDDISAPVLNDTKISCDPGQVLPGP